MKQNENLIYKIIIFLSFMCLNLLLLSNSSGLKISAVIIILCLFVSSYISFFKYKHMLKNKKIVILAIFISSYLCKFFIQYCWSNNIIFKILKYFSINESFFSYLRYIIGILSIPAITYVVLLCIEYIFPRIRLFYRKMTKLEKNFLLITLIISFLGSFIISNLTNIFYLDNIKVYDIIYTSDSGYLYNEDVFMNINMAENDLRQPLFGVFAIPFSFVAHFIGDNFILGSNGYAIMLITIQYLCISISLILISRMMKLKGDKQKLFFLFSYSCFSRLLFGLVIEQYVFAMFYLILTIYVYVNDYEEINYAYIPAVGSLITTGIVFPVITKFKNFKYWIKNVFKCFIVFMSIAIITGRVYEILMIRIKIIDLMRFSGKEILFSDKILQFINFISSMFVAPSSHIVENNGFYSYHLIEVTKINFIGVILLILSILGFVLNKKNKFSIMSLCWIVFSFIILCVVGWGTMENGLILYSLYFDWAYISLIYMFLLRLFKNKNIFKWIIIFVSLILFCINIYEIINIVYFGLIYY